MTYSSFDSRLEACLDRCVIAQPIGVEHRQVVACGDVERPRSEDVVEAATNRLALTHPPPTATLHCIAVAGAVGINQVIGRQPGQD